MREDAPPLSEAQRALSREERLAAKLRENLHRRKAQSRNLASSDQPALPKDESSG